MYVDRSPVPNSKTAGVIVLEEGDKPYDVDRIMMVAKANRATSRDGEDTIYWIVFAHEPERLWDFTEPTLRKMAKQAA